MSITAFASARSRHLVLRACAGDILPDALATKLRDEGVSTGWLRASGVLCDVELRAFDGEIGTLSRTHRIAGPVHVLTLEGSIGLSNGEPSFSLRAVLARETDRGLETVAGEIAGARTVALEVLVTALDDLELDRTLDEGAGVWLFDAPRGSRPAHAVASPPSTATTPATPAAWTSALEASEHAEREPPRMRRRPPSSSFSSSSASSSSTGSPAAGGAAVLPARPPRAEIDFDAPFPEPGDAVEHFAFGRADVIKSDGDRLHLKVHKDGRVREIALEMLRVSRMPDSADGKRRFKLERRL